MHAWEMSVIHAKALATHLSQDQGEAARLMVTGREHPESLTKNTQKSPEAAGAKQSTWRKEPLNRPPERLRASQNPTDHGRITVGSRYFPTDFNRFRQIFLIHPL